MEVNNPLYKGQGLHVITAIFTVDKGDVKVLLIKRKNKPYENMWALVGGALYNNETLLDGAKREIKEKIGIEGIDLYYAGLFDKVDRSPVMRMVAVTYIGVIDRYRGDILKETLKTCNADWFKISEVPKLAYDHNEILLACLEELKRKILETDVLKTLFVNGFTIPELQKVYETILNLKFDRRNFRKKVLSLDLIEDTGIMENFEGNKPAKVYRFKKNKKNNCKYTSRYR